MISVVIPLYNAIRYIESLLTQLNEQTQPHELILIDSSSTDGTPQWLRERNIPFHSIPTSEFNHGATRNLGVSLATGDYVVMLTQDALPTGPNSLAKLVAPLQDDESTALAYGRQLPYTDATPLSVYARQTNYPATSHRKTANDIRHMGIRACHCSNSFAAYRRSALLEIGGFPSDVILGEDVVVGARFVLSGKAIAYVGNAEVVHSHNYTIAEEFRRYFDIGAFHQQEQKLLGPFLRAESEGIKYVINEWRYLRQIQRLDLIPDQCIRTISKYTGYRFGRTQQRLPYWLKQKLSMHKAFWKKNATKVVEDR
ncbi:MAG: glycosyltransferase [Pedobacter sp.]|nr:MAG: glycosyltransferase [Pedobacter sp.]